MMSFHDMDDTNYQLLMSYILPPEGVEPLRRYLNVVGDALGCRTDAELAREMNVPANSIANWKRRGVVSEAGKIWFERELLSAVASPRTSVVVLNDIAANMVLLSLIVETEGNPLNLTGSDAAFANAVALPGLAQLTRLVGALRRVHGEPYGGGIDDPAILPLAREALAMFRRSDRFAMWRVDK